MTRRSSPDRPARADHRASGSWSSRAEARGGREGQTELDRGAGPSSSRPRPRSPRSRSAKTSFTDDYTTARPPRQGHAGHVDMPSLIVQLDRAARGTEITFEKIATGDPSAAPATPAPAAGATTGSTRPLPPAASRPRAGRVRRQRPRATPLRRRTPRAMPRTREQRGRPEGRADLDLGSPGPPGRGWKRRRVGLGTGRNLRAELVCVPLTMDFTAGFFDLTAFFHGSSGSSRPAMKT